MLKGVFIMRKVSNVIIGLLAAGVCGLITWLTLDSSFANIVYNLSFLVVMVIIIAAAFGISFSRLWQTRAGLDRATKKMKQIARGQLFLMCLIWMESIRSI